MNNAVNEVPVILPEVAELCAEGLAALTDWTKQKPGKKPWILDCGKYFFALLAGPRFAKIVLAIVRANLTADTVLGKGLRELIDERVKPIEDFIKELRPWLNETDDRLVALEKPTQPRERQEVPTGLADFAPKRRAAEQAITNACALLGIQPRGAWSLAPTVATDRADADEIAKLLREELGVEDIKVFVPMIHALPSEARDSHISALAVVLQLAREAGYNRLVGGSDFEDKVWSHTVALATAGIQQEPRDNAANDFRATTGNWKQIHEGDES